MAKQASLAAQAGALTQELRLPSIFTAPNEPVKARAFPPYIAFAHPKRADEWAKITAKYGQPEEGEMFLHLDGTVLKLDPAKLGWLAHKQYWAESNAAGTELIRSSFSEMPFPFKEHVEGVCIVYLEDRVVVANVCFRTTKCPAAKELADALAEAQTPGWGEKSPAHKETLVTNHPWMRFYGLVTLGEQRTSKASGMPYRTTKCEIHPTGVPEWRLLKEFEATAQKQLEMAADNFQRRVAEVSKKLIAK